MGMKNSAGMLMAMGMMLSVGMDSPMGYSPELLPKRKVKVKTDEEILEEMQSKWEKFLNNLHNFNLSKQYKEIVFEVEEGMFIFGLNLKNARKRYSKMKGEYLDTGESAKEYLGRISWLKDKINEDNK